MEEIDLFLKILIFVKILILGWFKKKGQEFRPLEVREAWIGGWLVIKHQTYYTYL